MAAELSAGVAIDEAGHCTQGLGVFRPADLVELGGEWVLAKGGRVDEARLDEHEHGIVRTETVEPGVGLGGIVWIGAHSSFQSTDPRGSHLPSIELVELDGRAPTHIAEVCKGHDRIAQQSGLLDVEHLQVVSPLELDLDGGRRLRGWPLVIVKLNGGRCGFGLLRRVLEIDLLNVNPYAKPFGVHR